MARGALQGKRSARGGSASLLAKAFGAPRAMLNRAVAAQDRLTPRFSEVSHDERTMKTV
jgi:hypothetical protein